MRQWIALFRGSSTTAPDWIEMSTRGGGEVIMKTSHGKRRRVLKKTTDPSAEEGTPFGERRKLRDSALTSSAIPF